MSVDVGQMDNGPSPGISKRTLLIGAVIIGGAAGLFILISKRAGGESGVPGEDQAQTSAPQAGALDIAYQNLATQLLGFRGDVSVANANLSSGQQDILSAVGAESATRATADMTLSGMLANWFAQVGAGQNQTNMLIGSELGQTNAAIAQQFNSLVGTAAANQSEANAQYGSVVGQAGAAAQQSASQFASVVGSLGANEAEQTAQYNSATGYGAGGANVLDITEALQDGGVGDASDHVRRLSAGPVRVVSRDRASAKWSAA